MYHSYPVVTKSNIIRQHKPVVFQRKFVKSDWFVFSFLSLCSLISMQLTFMLNMDILACALVVK